MNEYKENRNNDKWLAFVVALIVIATIILVVVAFNKIGTDVEEHHYNEGYESGYHDAKLTYQCDHDNTECEILKN